MTTWAPFALQDKRLHIFDPRAKPVACQVEYLEGWGCQGWEGRGPTWDKLHTADAIQSHLMHRDPPGNSQEEEEVGRLVCEATPRINGCQREPMSWRSGLSSRVARGRRGGCFPAPELGMGLLGNGSTQAPPEVQLGPPL